MKKFWKKESPAPEENRRARGRAVAAAAMALVVAVSGAGTLTLQADQPAVLTVEPAAVQQQKPEISVVFVTAYSDHALEAFGVGAIGYVLKPAQADQLDGILGRALEWMHRDAGEMFLCRSGQTLYRIPRASILYFESDRRKLRCVTTGRTYEFYGRLDEVERQLDSRFVRIHQRYLVRCAAVERAESGSVTVAGETLPVSRACQAAALAAIARASLEG